MSTRRPKRIKGHKLTLTFSGERSRAERSSTGTCACGWEESASTQAEVRNEYGFHLERVWQRSQSSATSLKAPTNEQIHAQLAALDYDWASRRLLSALSERHAECRAADLRAAWEQSGLVTATGRRKKFNTKLAVDFVEANDELDACLTRRSDRRAHLLFLVYDRNRRAHQDRRNALLDQLVPTVGTSWTVVHEVSENAYRTQGHGAMKYARGEAEEHADALAAAGIPVAVAEVSYPSAVQNGRPLRAVVVNAQCTGYDAEAVHRRALLEGSIVEWVRRCWARGLNPRVYNPHLPHGFEEQYGLDYLGNIKPHSGRVP